MAFEASQQVSQDISSAFGKGLHGLKVEAIATPKKGAGKGMTGRALAESVMLGVIIVAVAAIPVMVTRVPAPESLMAVVELLQDWCTPSICFGVLVVGGMIATSGVWSSEAGTLTTPEQNHKTFTEAYLSQGPVSATQIDPLRMPDIFFSPEAARAHALSHSATFPARGAAPPSSMAEPVYYPALIPPKPMQMEENGRFLGSFDSNAGERFMDERFDEDRFAPRADGRFSPRIMEGRFSPERFVASKGEERFGPRVEERFSPERFVNPQVEELYLPQAQDMYPEGEERYPPQAQETYPQVEERYESQEQGIFEAEEDLYESEDESIELGDCTTDDAPHAETATAHDDDGARSESEDEAHDEPEEEDARAPFDEAEFERELEREHVESKAAPSEPHEEWRSDAEDEVEHYPHESYEDDNQSLPDVVSPPPVPEALSAHQIPFSQRSGSGSAATTVASDVEPAAASLPSRRKPPTMTATASAQKVPPPPESVSTTTNPPHDFTTSARVERKETLEPTARASAPRIPPRHASARQPMPSSSSRSYAEFVRRTSNFSPKTPLEIPRPPAIAKPLVEPVASSTKPKVGRSSSTNSPAVTKQQSMPARRRQEVMVVDDEKLDETQGLSEDDDVNQRVEAFLKDFQEQIRLQRQQSLQRHKRSGLN